MGGSSSKVQAEKQQREEGQHGFVDRIKAQVEEELARKMMLQREANMAINMAKARDTIWIFGSAWTCLVTGVSAARLSGRKPPPIVGVPIVVGAIVLGNMADMAYGNKLARVVKEAEYLLEHERGRFVPFSQAPFSKFYTDEERASFYDPATAVGNLFPNRFIARGAKPEQK